MNKLKWLFWDKLFGIRMYLIEISREPLTRHWESAYKAYEAELNFEILKYKTLTEK